MQYNSKPNNRETQSENSNLCQYGLACFTEECTLKHTELTAKCSGCADCSHGFSGAGVLFVSKGFIILGQEAFGENVGLYDVLGGKCEGKSDTQTAIAEVREESAKLYNVTLYQLYNSKFVDIISGKHLFRTWIVNNDSISCTTFNSKMHSGQKLRLHHLSKIGGSNSKYSEIVQMRKFHVDLIERCGFVSSHLEVEGTGEHLPISERARKILQTAVRHGIFGNQISVVFDPYFN